jgi:hypothetical protein
MQVENKNKKVGGHGGCYARDAKLRCGMPCRRLARALSDAPEAGVFNPAAAAVAASSASVAFHLGSTVLSPRRYSAVGVVMF